MRKVVLFKYAINDVQDVGDIKDGEVIKGSNPEGTRPSGGLDIRGVQHVSHVTISACPLSCVMLGNCKFT